MKELGGGAERRFPRVQRGETIEREGQRVMAVRGGVTGLFKPASWGVEWVRWGLLGVRQGPGADRALSVAFHA